MRSKKSLLAAALPPRNDPHRQRGLAPAFGARALVLHALRELAQAFGGGDRGRGEIAERLQRVEMAGVIMLSP